MRQEPVTPLRASQLKELAAQANHSDLSSTCACRLQHAAGWESMPDERWPAKLMVHRGTLRDPAAEEPTFEEFHPDGTRYGSPEAPIAAEFFPFNRCDVYQCKACHLTVLRYTEYGGYYVDHRVRYVTASLVVT